MVDRHWLGDIGLAVLLALPLTALARPLPAHPQQITAVAKVATASHAPSGERVSLLG